MTLGTYVGLRWILRYHGRAPRPYLAILIPLQLLPLLFFKYGAFLFHQVLHWDLSEPHRVLNHLTGTAIPSLRDLVIPVGISFYTFQKVAFVVDTIAFKKPLPRFLDYLNFAGFFPQLVAGPIERRESLLPQMEQFRFRWCPELIDDGARWMALGFFFKCGLADNLAALFVRTSAATSAYTIWADNLLFGLRIYYDFAGYSLIALGLARCLGIRLTLNFASPYCSRDATEFWHRWHITLSQWFRDYLYIPLGGGRVGWWAFNVALVFVVSGLWHGAGWGFVLWGAMHGLFLIVHRLWGKVFRLPGFAGWLLMTVAAFGAWLCFYETRTGVLFQKLRALVTPSAYGMASLRETLGIWSGPNLLVLSGFLGLAGVVWGLEWLSLKRHGEPYALLLRPASAVVLVILTVLLAAQQNNGFIYFAF